MIEKAADGTYPISIGGREYVFSKWGAERSFEVLAQLSDLTLKPFALLAGAQRDAKSSDGKTDSRMLASAAKSFTRAMAKNPPTTLKLLKALICEKSICDGHQIANFDLHFKGKMAEMFQVAWASLQVQYGDFIDAASDFLPAVPAAPTKEPKPESSSTK